ncbi:hypothetical protein Lser_V15G19588 [Lactuca serriola]
MKNFLFAKNKVGFITGSIKKPGEDSAVYMPWMRADSMIKGWINTAMEKDIRTSVKYAYTSKEIWDDLEERFGKESAPRAYELKQSLTITRQEGTSVSAYYTKLRGLWDKIQTISPLPRCSCSTRTCDIGKRLNEFKEKEKLYEFLMGLDSEYSTIKTQILAMTNSKGQFRQQRKKSASKDIKKVTGEEVEHCNHCGKNGHNRDGCFKRIGYPDWWPNKAKQEKNKTKAAFVDSGTSPIPGLSNEQYQNLIKHFSKDG